MGMRFRRTKSVRREGAFPAPTPDGGPRWDPEALLLDRIARDREEAALIELYERIAPSVHACCLRILHDPDDAKDATAEAFWRLWNRAERYDPARCSAMAWIMTVTRRLALDHRRSAVRRDRAVDRAGQEPDEVDRYQQREEARIDIQAALRHLSEPDRCLLEAAYFEGLSGADIALRDDLPLGTVKSRMRAALRRLRLAVHGGQL